MNRQPSLYYPVPKPTSNKAKYLDSYFYLRCNFHLQFGMETMLYCQYGNVQMNNIYTWTRKQQLCVEFHIFLFRVSEIWSLAACGV